MLSLRKSIANFVYPEGLHDRRKLDRYANEDELTGLANRRAYDLAVESAEKDTHSEIIVFDMNNFGVVNKLEGHKSGDCILKLAADTLLECVQRIGRVFRYGGDEFVAIVPRGFSKTVIRRVELNFGTIKLVDGTIVSITGSYGQTFAEADRNLQALKNRRKLLAA